MTFSAFNNIASSQTVAGIPQSSQSAPVANQIQGGGAFLLLLVISCFWFRGLCQKRSQQAGYRAEQQVIAQQRQQLESLERIWKMNAYQKPESEKRS